MKPVIQICNNSKYILRNQTIGLPVVLNNLAKEITVEGMVLSVKSVLHISLVTIGQMIIRHKIDILDFEEKIVADFCEYVGKYPIEFVDFTGEYRFAWQNELRTLVAMCNVSNLDGFFELINKKYNLQIAIPPTHITLYTLQPEMGIFLVDEDDIKQMSKRVDLPNLIILVN
jgi:hypothetical protein